MILVQQHCPRQARRRPRRPQARRGLDLPNRPGDNVRAEYAYRRGFNHAANFAVRAIADGATLGDLLAWYDQVDEWRNADRRTRVESPPIPDLEVTQ